MKKVFASIGLVFAAALVAFPAHANIIYSEVEFFATNSSAVGYMEFEVTNAGTFTIDAFGFSTLGEWYNGDTMLQLFSGSLAVANHLGGDDDSGIGSDAQLVIGLGLGSYILAASDYELTVQNAIGGFTNEVE